MITEENNKYISPSVEILEVENESVLCQSGTNEPYNDGDTSGWYN